MNLSWFLLMPLLCLYFDYRNIGVSSIDMCHQISSHYSFQQTSHHEGEQDYFLAFCPHNSTTSQRTSGLFLANGTKTRIKGKSGIQLFPVDFQSRFVDFLKHKKILFYELEIGAAFASNFAILAAVAKTQRFCFQVLR